MNCICCHTPTDAVVSRIDTYAIAGAWHYVYYANTAVTEALRGVFPYFEVLGKYVAAASICESCHSARSAVLQKSNSRKESLWRLAFYLSIVAAIAIIAFMAIHSSKDFWSWKGIVLSVVFLMGPVLVWLHLSEAKKQSERREFPADEIISSTPEFAQHLAQQIPMIDLGNRYITFWSPGGYRVLDCTHDDVLFVHRWLQPLNYVGRQAAGSTVYCSFLESASDVKPVKVRGVNMKGIVSEFPRRLSQRRFPGWVLFDKPANVKITSDPEAQRPLRMRS